MMKKRTHRGMVLSKDNRPADEARAQRYDAAALSESFAEDWAWLDAIAGTMSEDFMADGRGQCGASTFPATRPTLRE